ncbi:MAG TPA: hypothetical protein VK419_07265 [Bryobacteraceae bacterium]|nr:hypothetical protein [Bryobacteraceae bacterium]
MTRRIQQYRTAASLLACFLSLMLPLSASDEKPAADNGETKTTAAVTSATSSDIEQLKQMLIEQQKQINELRQELAAQKKSEDKTAPAAAQANAPAAPTNPPTAQAAAPEVHKSLGEVASTTGALPPAPPAPEPGPVFNPPAAVPPPQVADNSGTSPLQFKIGDAYITPVGFMDMTVVSRSTNPGSGIGTNFGSIPYGNTQTGALSETRLSIQNSRIGARVDALVKGWRIMGYWESDFLGQLGNPPNGGLAVTSNPFVFRMRLYWVDLTKGKFEFLAGQSWSMATPNRSGISPLPSDIFYSQDMDVNYQLGLTWSRVGSYRFILHPTNKVAFGVAFENSEPYIGGGNGGSAAVLPSAFSGEGGTEINNGTSVISAPALMPDIIAKLAFDPSNRLHFEVVGIGVADKIANPTGVAGLTPFATNTKFGGGVEANLNAGITKNVRFILNTFYSDGAGRYVFGQAPDFIVRADGSISLVHSASTTTGFEATFRNTLFYTYYGGVYIGKDMAFDSNGKTLIGYGPISSDGQNRAIQEFSIGTNTTLMRDSRWGALNLITQYSYVQRNPWLAAAGAPADAFTNMGYIDLRYTLPGSAPVLGH